MLQIFFLLSLSIWLLVAAEKPPLPQSEMVSISSKVRDGKTYVTAKIPYGQGLQISCPQMETEQPLPANSPTHLEQAGESPHPVQTVHIVGTKYLVPEGAANCRQTALMSTDEILACSKQTSTFCVVNSKDPSTQKGCKKRRLGVKYFCDDALLPAPPKAMKLMPNNMLDDFD